MASTSPTPPAGAHTLPHKPLRRRTRLLGSLLAVIALGGTGWLTWHLTHPTSPGGPGMSSPSGAGGPSGRRGPPASTVGVATAKLASIPVTLEALGTVTPQASVKVRPQVSGVLDKVLFKEGQKVRTGDLLATLDARPFELALQQASGQRQRDEAQLDSARVTLQRFKTLLTQDSIARQEVDTQAALVKQLEGTVLIDKANEGVARLNLSYTRITAPISGRVGLRTVDVGNVVSSSDANGIALITQITPIDVVFAVPQDQAGALQQSAAAGTAMAVAALDRTRSATLDTGVFASLDNQVDTTTGTVKAKARFANAALALFPNQFVNVRLQLATIDNAVVVPVTALRHGNDGDYVYVLNAAERTVSLRPVQRGQATADSIQITSGLKAGEQVITEGADRLKDGASVTLPGDAPGGGAGRGAGGKKRQRPDGAPRAEGQSGGAASAPAPGSASSAGLAASSALDAASAPRRHRRASQAEGA
jgi:multidrug efflux system membrane fusion protein